ncbi:DMT family transporter [Shewanella sp. OMA3-2]|uniref:DMT family transporter n=1 Tax=Shewanella sp. OMA3-2 TaxID=2908650 RepID=UPI001F271AE2|nr:DMT family transporter [Shewanella sp. OMA3-2]UJF21114.1 DMT family transporter [Shewanella sp. OMA3-2]
MSDKPSTPSSLVTAILTFTALVAFAANSVLSRMALSGGDASLIDPDSFTLIRLLAGAITLWFIVGCMHFYQENPVKSLDPSSSFKPSSPWLHQFNKWRKWCGAFSLLAYAWLFSIAYQSLDTATGALVLFGAVQLSMNIAAIIQGQKPSIVEVVGSVIAFTGLGYLLWPNIGTPQYWSMILMVLSGVAWGMYSLLGRQSLFPVLDSAHYFSRSVGLMLAGLMVLSLAMNIDSVQLTLSNMLQSEHYGGVVLAIISGALTSGIGYAIWYKALTGLTPSKAAALQLSVPFIAAIGGVIFNHETLSLHLISSGAIILSGISMVLIARNKSC